MKNLLSIFGLLLLCSAGIYGNYNLYLNEHETMRLLGELSWHNNKTNYCAKFKVFFACVCLQMLNFKINEIFKK